jgi:urease beta subunit
MAEYMDGLSPGEIMSADGDITINEGRETATVEVENTGDRAVQVGSHFHFFEVNRALDFDRERAFGMHLDIPSGGTTRFEPGEQRDADLVAFAGKRRIIGLNGLTDSTITYDAARAEALERLEKWEEKWEHQQ